MVDGLDELGHGRLRVGVGQRVEHFVSSLWHRIGPVAEVVSSDALGKFHVLLHHRHSVSVDGAEV